MIGTYLLRGGCDGNLEQEALAMAHFEVLGTAEAPQATAYHDTDSLAQCLALIHAVRNNAHKRGRSKFLTETCYGALRQLLVWRRWLTSQYQRAIAVRPSLLNLISSTSHDFGNQHAIRGGVVIERVPSPEALPHGAHHGKCCSSP